MDLVLAAAPRRDGGYEGWIEYVGPSPVRFLIWRDGESLGAVPFVRDRQTARFVYPKPGKYTVTVDLPDGSTARSNEVEIRADVVPAAGFGFFDAPSAMPWWRTHRTALLVIGAILLLVLLYFTFVFRAEWIDRSGLTRSTWSMRRATPAVPDPMTMTPAAAGDVSAACGVTALAITGPLGVPAPRRSGASPDSILACVALKATVQARGSLDRPEDALGIAETYLDWLRARKRPTKSVLPGPGVIADSRRHGGADGQARFEAAGDGEAGGAVASQREVGGLVREGSGNSRVPAVVLGPALGGERSRDIRSGARDSRGERGDDRELRALPRRRPTPRDPGGSDGSPASTDPHGASRVLTLPPSVRVSLATGATDMRRSVDGLRALVLRHSLGDPYSGHLFVFRNRRGDRLKILVWDRSGFWVLYKRLEKGTFAWPETSETGAMSIHAGDLALLLSGVDPARTKSRTWYERAA